MLALANALRGEALLIERVGELLYGERAKVQAEVDASFESSSLVVPVHILSDGLRAAERLLAGEGFTAFANLLALLGFAGVNATSLYDIFKRRRGRPIEQTEDIPRRSELALDIPIELLIRIYDDQEVQTELRKSIDPLHLEGIQEFQARRQGVITTRLSKIDLQSADEAELESLTRDEEIELDIEKAAWRRNLAWHFNDGRTSFDARIDDDAFWKRVEQGEPFADGDRLRVHLRTTARRAPNGRLKVERRIPTVLGVEHARRNIQRDMFNEE